MRLLGRCLILIAVLLLLLVPAFGTPGVILGVLIGVPLLVCGARLFDKGKLMLRVDANAILSQDPRPPVLYLRSFRNAGANSARAPLLRHALNSTTDEERLSVVMNQVGPFVALGETNKRRGAVERKDTDFGAARLYVSDEMWKDEVIRLMKESQLVVIRLDPLREGWGSFHKDSHQYALEKGGLNIKERPRPDDFIPLSTSAPVGWELEQVKNLKLSPERVLIYLPFKAHKAEREEIYQDVRSLVEGHMGRTLPERLGTAKFIGFRHDGTAYLLKHSRLPSFGVVNLYARNLQPFFKQLGPHSIKTTIDYFGAVELLVNSVALSFFCMAILLSILSVLSD